MSNGKDRHIHVCKYSHTSLSHLPSFNPFCLPCGRTKASINIAGKNPGHSLQQLVKLLGQLPKTTWNYPATSLTLQLKFHIYTRCSEMFLLPPPSLTDKLTLTMISVNYADNCALQADWEWFNFVLYYWRIKQSFYHGSILIAWIIGCSGRSKVWVG